MSAPRFELSGPMAPSGPPGPANPSNPPPLILTYLVNGSFDPAPYLDQGYTRFDVIAIGAGGGQGGFIDSSIGTTSTGTQPSGTDQKEPGGAGGGGGIQYVKRGLLAALPSPCAIVVGAGGAPGVSSSQTPTATTDGADGTASSFNGSTCQASGGKGGKRASAFSSWAGGGAGGLGGTTVAGGGGAGGIGSGPPTPGQPGSWNPSTGIGGGGGGGSGGEGAYAAQAQTTGNISATDGGGGAYNATDLSVYAPGTTKSADGYGLSTGTIFPGTAGGAKAAPLTGLSTTYGNGSPVANGVMQNTTNNNPYHVAGSLAGPQPGNPGVVVVRITAS